MANEERAEIEAHYQMEIESIRGEVARLTYLLEQVLSFKNGKEISAQPPMKTSSVHVPRTSQNLGANSVNEHHFVLFAPIYQSQAQITVDPTEKGPSDNKSTSPTDYDKWVALKERLRVVKGNNVIDPVLATEVVWFQTLWCRRSVECWTSSSISD